MQSSDTLFKTSFSILAYKSLWQLFTKRWTCRVNIKFVWLTSVSYMCKVALMSDKCTHQILQDPFLHMYLQTLPLFLTPAWLSNEFISMEMLFLVSRFNNPNWDPDEQLRSYTWLLPAGGKWSSNTWLPFREQMERRTANK